MRQRLLGVGGLGHLLHPSGQVRRLSHRRVIHLEVVANRSDDDVA